MGRLRFAGEARTLAKGPGSFGLERDGERALVVEHDAALIVVAGDRVLEDGASVELSGEVIARAPRAEVASLREAAQFEITHVKATAIAWGDNASARLSAAVAPNIVAKTPGGKPAAAVRRLSKRQLGVLGTGFVVCGAAAGIGAALPLHIPIRVDLAALSVACLASGATAAHDARKLAFRSVALGDGMLDDRRPTSRLDVAIGGAALAMWMGAAIDVTNTVFAWGFGAAPWCVACAAVWTALLAWRVVRSDARSNAVALAMLQTPRLSDDTRTGATIAATGRVTVARPAVVCGEPSALASLLELEFDGDSSPYIEHWTHASRALRLDGEHGQLEVDPRAAIWASTQRALPDKKNTPSRDRKPAAAYADVVSDGAQAIVVGMLRRGETQYLAPRAGAGSETRVFATDGDVDPREALRKAIARRSSLVLGLVLVTCALGFAAITHPWPKQAPSRGEARDDEGDD
jgi:hypothetical protein